MKKISVRAAATLAFALALTSVCVAFSMAEGSESQTEISAELSASYKFGPDGDDVSKAAFSPAALVGIRSSSSSIDLLGSLSMNRDGKYGAALADIPGGNLFGFYFLLEEGGARARLGGAELELGRFKFKDRVDSPYSLFVSSRGISSTTMAFSYTAGPFFYHSRWVGLNHDSGLGFPERGATIKDFGLGFGEMRLGFQDAIVYAGRWFDYEYFLSPIPMYFTQYVRGTGGAPWTAGYDDNTIMGLFWAWDRPGSFSCLAQVLVDDFGLGGILSGWPLNPWQLALSLGGRMETAAGSFGLYSAMATKYTFEPSNAVKASDAYGYTYYPDTRFTSYWQDTGTTVTSPIAIEDNEIGYEYGENNLAVRADWRGRAFGMDLGSALEFRLSGSNSPANPGHEDSAILSTGTKWLDEGVLEKRFTLSAEGSKNLGPWRFFGRAKLGLALDSLGLRSPSSTTSGTANDIWIYKPTEGNTKYIFSIGLGARYTFEKGR